MELASNRFFLMRAIAFQRDLRGSRGFFEVTFNSQGASILDASDLRTQTLLTHDAERPVFRFVFRGEGEEPITIVGIQNDDRSWDILVGGEKLSSIGSYTNEPDDLTTIISVEVTAN